MKQSSANRANSVKPARAKEHGSARTTSLVLGCFLVGVAVSAFWFYRGANQGSGTVAAQNEGALSDATLAVLKRLDSPLELKFYSLLDPAATSDALRAFAGRVDQLLSLYRQEANGQIKVTRYTSLADASQAAAADGLKPFNLDKGDACYLGVAVVRGARKEVLAQLSPDWESALQSDLSRAIARLIDASGPGRASAIAARIDAATIEEVKRTFPDLQSVSVEEGSQKLHDAAINDMKAAVTEMDAKIKEAEQRLTQAQNGGSDADKQAAIKDLQQIQAAQTEKLKQISARAAAQIEALKQLKAGGP
jgi:ABC-type uncharacterized transport system involved in gliding motility auxiliary subunit